MSKVVGGEEGGRRRSKFSENDQIFRNSFVKKFFERGRGCT
jgi:hypothetical protein